MADYVESPQTALQMLAELAGSNKWPFVGYVQQALEKKIQSGETVSIDLSFGLCAQFIAHNCNFARFKIASNPGEQSKSFFTKGHQYQKLVDKAGMTIFSGKMGEFSGACVASLPSLSVIDKALVDGVPVIVHLMGRYFAYVLSNTHLCFFDPNAGCIQVDVPNSSSVKSTIEIISRQYVRKYYQIKSGVSVDYLLLKSTAHPIYFLMKMQGDWGDDE
ncbi:hypothetical protein DC094_19055 [Pelagibaculum spongiae]|uniref:Uncharacterized protein n=2 Tax=Pelagibaculum spongiae TaxID=2080658 RepID=A0A2V1GWD6_9GAMM|nr:hypothetical protein DC094_19055 [Pelagibaculum spongiae]